MPWCANCSRSSAPNPRLAHARANLESHLGEIIDGADLIRLAERELMEPLDAEARRMVSNAAKRVSLVTAVSPRAAVDLLFVLFTALSLMRRLALPLWRPPGHARHDPAVPPGAVAPGTDRRHGGGRQSDFASTRPWRGGALSARLGEGVLNGLLTARLGLAAIEVTRPLPFAALPPPALADLAKDLLRKRDGEE